MKGLTELDMQKLDRMSYESKLDRFLKRSPIELMFPNVRGASIELNDDMKTLGLGKFDKSLGVEKLTRLRDICKYFISKKSNRRKSYDSPNSKTKIVKDKFTVYEEYLKQIEELLKDA